MIKIKWIIVWSCIIIFTPVVCNCILLSSHPNWINVVACPKDWLSFFGGYIGSVISTTASFIVLWYTIKENREQIVHQQTNNYEREKLKLDNEEIREIQKEIAERFSQFDLSVMLNLSTITKKDPKCLVNDLPKLQALHEKYMALNNSAKLLYGSDEDEKCKEFFSFYSEVMDSAIVLLHNYIVFITKAQNEFYMTNEMIETLFDFSRQAETIINGNQTALEYAKNYINWLVYNHREQGKKVLKNIEN